MYNSDSKRNYKYCIVPECQSTTVNTPAKTFITVPRNLKMRRKWQQTMKREKRLTTKSTYFVCEDHFNLEKDMKNYMYYKLMDNVHIKMRPDVVPHMFDCQKNRTITESLKDSRLFLKRKRETILEEINEPSTSKISGGDNDFLQRETDITKGLNNPDHSIKITQCNKQIQVNIKPKMLSKETQCNRRNILRKPERSTPSNSSTDGASSYSSCFSEMIVNQKD